MALQLRTADHLVVRVPMRTSQRQVNYFVDTHAGWIQKQQQKLRTNPGLPDDEYRDGGFLWLLGERLEISVVQGSRQVKQLSDNRLQVSHPDGDPEAVVRQIERWRRTYALTLFEELSQALHAEFKTPLPAFTLTVRRMSRQWGNCSRGRLIKLNVNLLRYPLACIRHVIRHELCHLKYFNHSRDFYALLEQVEPDWREQKHLLQTFSG